jgi:murein DD-endopeptidase MepM/ murein hydrolase activator NlpD
LKTVITQKVPSVPSPAAHGATLDRQVAIAGPDVKEGLIKQASLNSDRFASPRDSQQQASKFLVGLATCSLLVSPFSGSAVATNQGTFSTGKVLPIVSSVAKEDVYMQQLRQDASAMRNQNKGTDAVFMAPQSNLVAQKINTFNNFNSRQAASVGYSIPVSAPAVTSGIAIPVPAPRSLKLPTSSAAPAQQVATSSYNSTTTTNQSAPPVGMSWPAQGSFTSGYGRRWGRMHKGIDIAAPVGTPIVAAADGEVVRSGYDTGGFGNRVDIRHADGTRTLYGHNSRLLVAVGQRVKQGQQIAAMGSTGRSTGPHLHFEFHVSGGDAVNPVAYLPSAPRS